MLRVYYNFYVDPDPARDLELKTCRQRLELCEAVDDVVYIGGRPTFQELFDRITCDADANDISVILNSDCFLDDSILLANRMKAGECYALSRHDVTCFGRPELFDRSDSQDAWVFRGKIKPLKRKADFTMGKPGCDNAIAYILLDAGYLVSNPSKSIKVYHLHLTGVRRYDKTDTVPNPYHLIRPHTIG